MVLAGFAGPRRHPQLTEPQIQRAQASSRIPTIQLPRLDELFLQLGKYAVRSQLPDSLQTSQAAALAAAEEMRAATVEVHRVEQSQSAAVGQSESLQTAASISKARLAAVQAETRSRFAHIALGRMYSRQFPPQRTRKGDCGSRNPAPYLLRQGKHSHRSLRVDLNTSITQINTALAIKLTDAAPRR